MVVEVSVPSSVVMIQNFPVEVEVGKYIVAAATLKAEDGTCFIIDVNIFTACILVLTNEVFQVATTTNVMLLALP